jgi:glycosyltransferase involved in cell wall biosynthesis
VYIVAMHGKKHRILAVFSDVNFSPQLIAILQKLNDSGTKIRIVLIGNTELEIAKQVKLRNWDLRNIAQRGKYCSVLNLLLLALEILKFQPQTLFASGQFATIIGMLSAKMLNVPHRVFIRHHSNLHHKYKMKFGIMVDRISNRLATRIVAVSMVVKKILIENESVNQHKISLIHNGVDLMRFESDLRLPKPTSTHTLTKSHVFNIGVISRLTEWKGVEYAATAFVKFQEEFPNSHLHIVGAFSDSYTNVKNILSVVDSDSYVLESSNYNIPLFLKGLDVFVHVPVGKDDEAFGIVYVEALASRVPSIFTQSGVLNELKSPDRYAHLVAFRNSEEIYTNLVRLIQSKHDSKDAVPKSWLNQFSLEKMTNSYAELLLSESP